jgi:transposase
MAVLTLQSIAARVRFLSAQVDELDPELMTLLKQHPAGPALLAEPGVGPVVAAQLLVSWSHRGRVRSEAAFAALSGTAPLEASSGQRTRHRLNRGGDRDLNRALHTVAITRMRCHPETRAYHAKRTAGQDPSRHPTLSQASPRPPALPTNPSRHTPTADPRRGLTT